MINSILNFILLIIFILVITYSMTLSGIVTEIVNLTVSTTFHWSSLPFDVADPIEVPSNSVFLSPFFLPHVKRHQGFEAIVLDEVAPSYYAEDIRLAPHAHLKKREF